MGCVLDLLVEHNVLKYNQKLSIIALKILGYSSLENTIKTMCTLVIM